MKHFDSSNLESLPSRYRAHLINSCSGYKSANLIGTSSNEAVDNLAIFSSVMHVGSNPPLLSLLFRPLTVERHTYANIKETGVFTVNHVHEGLVEIAHQTSAKYDSETSEFEKVGLTPIRRADFEAPFVAESRLGVGCTYVNEYEIKENGCVLVIASIQHIFMEEKALLEDGWVDLESIETAAISGQDAYAVPKLIHRLSYAKPDEDVKPLQ